MCVCVCLSVSQSVSQSVCYRFSCFNVRLYLRLTTPTGFSYGYKRVDFRKNLPFESYGVEKPFANEFELTANGFRAPPRSTKNGNYLIDNW